MSYRGALICVIVLTIAYICKADDAEDLVNFPEKCYISDMECQMNMMTSMFTKFSDTGIESLGIPRFDPYHIMDTTVNILNMANMTMTEGLAEGAKSCSLIKFETNFEDKYTYTETFCESFKVSGRYKTELGPLAQALIGNSFRADGFGTIQVDKMTLNMMIPFSVDKLEDGEIYLIPKVDEAEYSIDEIENIKFGTEKGNVLFGGIDIGRPLINFMNKNWEMINSSFGHFFTDKMMNTFYGHMMQFFPKVAASRFFADDLSSYVDARKKSRKNIKKAIKMY